MIQGFDARPLADALESDAGRRAVDPGGFTHDGGSQ